MLKAEKEREKRKLEAEEKKVEEERLKKEKKAKKKKAKEANATESENTEEVPTIDSKGKIISLLPPTWSSLVSCTPWLHISHYPLLTCHAALESGSGPVLATLCSVLFQRSCSSWCLGWSGQFSPLGGSSLLSQRTLGCPPGPPGTGPRSPAPASRRPCSYSW